MKVLRFFLIVLSILSLSCDPEETGFGGTKSISGRVVHLDSLGISKIPAVNATVYVGFGTAPTPENYGFKTSADSLGNFTINNILESEDTTYKLFIVYKAKFSGVEVLYTKAMAVKSGVIAEDVEVERNKDLIRVEGTVKGKLLNSSSDSYISGATVYIGYSTAPSADKYLYKLVTDKDGRFFSPFIEIKDPAKCSLLVIYHPSDGPILSATTTLADMVPMKGIVKLTPDTGFGTVAGTIQGYDYAANGKLANLSNAEIYVGIGFDPSPSNYSFATKSLQQGKFSVYNIPISDIENLYYSARYSYSVNNKLIPFKKSFKAVGNDLSLGNIILAPEELPGICQLMILDDRSTPQPNIHVCIFSNKAGFDNSKGCMGSIFEGQTNSYGNVFVNDLQNGGTYYIRGISVVGGDTLKVKVAESIKVDNTYPQTFTLKIQ